MFDRFLKINTCGEQRWINVDRVTRVSHAVDNEGNEVLSFCFGELDKVMLHGNNDETRAVIARVVASLDVVSDTMILHQGY